MDNSANSDFDNSTIYTPTTPPSSIANLTGDALHDMYCSASDSWENTTTIRTPPETIMTSHPETSIRSRSSEPAFLSALGRLGHQAISGALILLFIYLGYHYFKCTLTHSITSTVLSSPKPTFSFPSPDSTFRIRSVNSKKVITLLNEQVTLEPSNNGGSTHWKCVDTKGWLGFQSSSSNRLLGHDGTIDGPLICKADAQYGWENFCVGVTEGGFVLMMQHWVVLDQSLWYVGSVMVDGSERLRRVKEVENAVVWEFEKVSEKKKGHWWEWTW